MDYPYTYELRFLLDEYEQYLKDPKSISEEMACFFDGFALGSSEGSSVIPYDLEALKLLHHYRHFGYLKASFNPLKPPSGYMMPKVLIPKKELVNSYGLFSDEKVPFELFEKKLLDVYASSCGYEFLHCDSKIISYIQNFLEKKETLNREMSDEEVYTLLAKTEYFETFLHTRFPGQKRFSIEGLETSIVFLEETLRFSEKLGFKGAFIGMAHRGRLNVLANIFQKPLGDIFKEFSKQSEPYDPSMLGDVKYHLGANHKTKSGFELTLSSNPSHLEAVDPVILGMSYAKQKISSDKTITYMIHGDASFAGQGVVYETMQIAKIQDFDPKGVIHIILNNQIGFTAVPEESRSTSFASDLAKAFNCPIFHVNSEDVDSLQKIAQLSCELIKEFGCDVMIDIVGYRKWGHNESDEPTFTQPLLYKSLKERKNPLEMFRNHLLQKRPELSNSLDVIDQKIKQTLQSNLEHPTTAQPIISFNEQEKDQLIVASTLLDVGSKITTIPQNFHIHAKLQKLYQERHDLISKSHDLDFAFCELLALGCVLKLGHNIRFVGQDSQRGTFSQRHAVLVDQESQAKYNIFEPLVSKNQFCQIVNSPLSEYAVLGFEYGFSKIAPKTLCLWEAQFGDFANGAQIIIDQFIASGKTKWNDKSNLTLLLPHGYEGQGPEHTSARIERFLELCGENNMTVAIPSTPAQYFKLLMKQSQKHIPLVVFTPKALLRHPACKSPFKDLSEGEFEPIIDDMNYQATVVVFCYGKIYFDLKKLKDEKKLSHISLIRLEQLYPLDLDRLHQLIKKRAHLKKTVLVQDEPFNMGACMYLKSLIENLDVISRPAASSPATGYQSLHEKQLNDILTPFERL